MDRALEIIITCGPIILAGMGLYVSIRPPHGKPWVHWIWFGAFVVVGGLTATASYREMRDADDQQIISFVTQKDTNAEIQNLISSIDKLSTGVAQINTTQGYQFLTNPQADTLIQTLRPFANSAVKVSISCEVGDAKACFLASQWDGILKLAGWKSNGTSSVIYVTPPFGVFITVNSADTPGSGVIQRALLTTGIIAQGQIDPKTAPSEIDLLFGAYKSSS